MFHKNTTKYFKGRKWNDLKLKWQTKKKKCKFKFLHDHQTFFNFANSWLTSSLSEHSVAMTTESIFAPRSTKNLPLSIACSLSWNILGVNKSINLCNYYFANLCRAFNKAFIRLQPWHQAYFHGQSTLPTNQGQQYIMIPSGILVFSHILRMVDL